MGGGCWQSGREEERRRAAAGGEARAEAKLERRAGSSGLRCALAPLRRSVRGDSRADVRFAVEAAAPGAAAPGRQAVGVDAVCGAGGARHPGATGPHPGGEAGSSSTQEQGGEGSSPQLPVSPWTSWASWTSRLSGWQRKYGNSRENGRKRTSRAEGGSWGTRSVHHWTKRTSWTTWNKRIPRLPRSNWIGWQTRSAGSERTAR